VGGRQLPTAAAASKTCYVFSFVVGSFFSLAAMSIKLGVAISASSAAAAVQSLSVCVHAPFGDRPIGWWTHTEEGARYKMSNIIVLLHYKLIVKRQRAPEPKSATNLYIAPSWQLFRGYRVLLLLLQRQRRRRRPWRNGKNCFPIIGTLWNVLGKEK
jgi:hypothetical protein